MGFACGAGLRTPLGPDQERRYWIAELQAECRRTLGPVRNESHLLLACTHYPAIAPLLALCLTPRVQLVDPAPALLEELLALPDLP